ncbi:MAG: sigma 54-interacting transcriptional regulator, partial [Planctomycetota bacterium]
HPAVVENREALIRLVPEVFPGREPGASGPAGDPTVLREAVSNLIMGAAKEHPILIALDDLQWADRETLETVAFLTRALDVARRRSRPNPDIVLLCAARRGGSSETVFEAFHWPGEEKGSPVLHGLAPLTVDEVAELVESIFGEATVPRSFVERLHGASSGNPLFIEELLKSFALQGRLRWTGRQWDFPQDGPDDLPEALDAVFEDVLKPGEGSDVEVLEALAVWEGPAHPSELKALLSEMSAADRADSLRRLQRRGFVERSGARGRWTWRIPQGLLRTFIRNRLTPERKRELHRLAGNHLESTDPRDRSTLEARARHLLAGEMADPGISRAIEAALTLGRVFQFERGLSLLEGALRLTDPEDHSRRTEIHLEMANLNVRAGDIARTLANLREVEAHAKNLGHEAGESLAKALVNAGEMLRNLGRLEEAKETLIRAEDMAKRHDSPLCLGKAKLNRASVLENEGRWEEAKALSDATLSEIPELSGTDIEAFEHLDRANRLTMAGDREGALARVDRAEKILEVLPHKKGLPAVHRFRGAAELQGGRLSRARVHLDEALRSAREIGNRKAEILTLEVLVHTLVQLAKYGEAQEAVQRGLDLARMLGDGVGEHRLLTQMGPLHLVRGEFEEGRELLQGVVRFWMERKLPYFAAISEGALAQIEVAQGRLPEAAPRIRRILAAARTTGDPSLRSRGLLLLAEYHLARGKPALVVKVADRTLGRRIEAKKSPGFPSFRSIRALALQRLGQEEEASREGQRASSAASGENRHMAMEVALRLAVLARERGDGAEAAKQLESLLARSRDPGSRRLEMQVLAELGETLRGQGENEEAESVLRRALAMNRAMPAKLEGASIRLGLACLLLDRGKEGEAHTLRCEAQSLAEEANCPPLLRGAAEFAQQPARQSGEFHEEPAQGTPSAGVALKALLDLFRSFHEGSPLPTLMESVVDSAISLSGASRGFLLMKNEEGLESVVSRNLEAGREKDAEFSRTVAREVFSTGRLILSEDAGADPSFSGARSIRDLRIRSVLCVALRAEGERIGALYVDDPGQVGIFGPGDGEVVQGLADLTGLLIQQARMRSRLEESEAILRERTMNLEEQVQTQVLVLEEVREQLHAKDRQLEGRDVYGELEGRSEAMRAVFDVLDRVTASSLPVVIEGETGTGKELVARAIHGHGPRAKGPYVAVNCAALPEALLESELFGHVKGAFTGADRDRKGLFQIANGGTLLLDEIGDMPLPLQAKLL